VWIEEHLPGIKVDLPDVNKWLKRAINISADNGKRGKAAVGFEFARDFNDNPRINIRKYQFRFSELVSDYEPGEEKRAAAKVTEEAKEKATASTKEALEEFKHG
jgi:hypothetical protein